MFDSNDTDDDIGLKNSPDETLLSNKNFEFKYYLKYIAQK